ncbi:MAG: NAD(P)/FAD-dependent oxidoreductase [Pyrinomonadaceae bacterium]
MSEKKRILILGGGFGGLYTALHLEKTLARDEDVTVTLVNRENFFLFTPMLHEVAASDLDITHIVSPARKLLKRVDFFHGDVEKIDLPNKKVYVSHGQGKEHHEHELNYTHLVLALGSITNFFNLPGLAERAVTMKSLGDAIHLRNRLISNLEEADFECYPEERKPLLNFVVAGGGFAGVETIGGINDFLREAIRFYPHLKKEMLRVILVHPGKVVLPELSEKLGLYTQQKLAERGVEIRLETKVESYDDNEVLLSDGERIPTYNLIWTGGNAPNPHLEGLPCRKERGRLCANEFLEVEGFENVWAVGDCAAVADKKNGDFHPPTAQHAIRQGKTIAHNIKAAIRRGNKKAFDFTTLGQLAAIGRRTGVAQIFGMNFSGFPAWWLWRTIYLSKLPRFEKKLRVALDWTLDLIFSKDLVQFQTLRAPSVSMDEREMIEKSGENAGQTAAEKTLRAKF